MKSIFKRSRDLISKNLNYFYDDTMDTLEKLLVQTYSYNDIKINKDNYEKLFSNKYKMGWDLNSSMFLIDDRMYERFIKIISYKGKLEEEKIFMFFDKLENNVDSKKIIIDSFSNNITNYNQFEKFTKKIQTRIMEIYRILINKPKRDTKIILELFKMYCYNTVNFYDNVFRNLFRLIELNN